MSTLNKYPPTPEFIPRAFERDDINAIDEAIEFAEQAALRARAEIRLARIKLLLLDIEAFFQRHPGIKGIGHHIDDAYDEHAYLGKRINITIIGFDEPTDIHAARRCELELEALFAAHANSPDFFSESFPTHTKSNCLQHYGEKFLGLELYQEWMALREARTLAQASREIPLGSDSPIRI
jgi:hypothetical protein